MRRHPDIDFMHRPQPSPGVRFPSPKPQPALVLARVGNPDFKTIHGKPQSKHSIDAIELLANPFTKYGRAAIEVCLAPQAVRRARPDTFALRIKLVVIPKHAPGRIANLKIIPDFR